LIYQILLLYFLLRNNTIKVKNVYGENANISYYDPIVDKTIPIKIIGKSRDNVVVEVEAIEYPRLLIIEEKKN